MLIWVAPISAYYFDWDVDYLIKKYVLCINPSQLWFLWMLFDVFVIVWLLRRIMMRSSIIGWGISIAFYCVGILGNRLLSNIFCVWTACQYVPIFYVGMRIMQKEANGEKRITQQIPWYLWLVADGMLFAGVTLVSQMDGVIRTLISVSLNFVLHIVGGIMAWTVLQSLAAHVKWKDNRCFMTLSSYSMSMYLFHQQIIYFTIVLLNGKVNPWLHAGINFVVAFIGSVLISVTLVHWKITRNLVGEK